MINQSVESGKIYIYGDIGDWYESETSAAAVKKSLEAIEENRPVDVHINSYGGEVKEALAIYNMLHQRGDVTVHVDGMACSAASMIAMAGNRVVMAKNALMMVHHVWTCAAGNPTELRKAADDLEIIDTAAALAYLEKAGDKLSSEQLQKMLDNETWLNADQCIAYGLADELVDETASGQVEELKQKALKNAAAKINPAGRAPEGEAKNNAERLMKAFKKKLEE